MITLEDLNPHNFPLTEEQTKNLTLLAEKLTVFENAFLLTEHGFLFKITSGVRSVEDHYRIYKAKGIDNPPMGSQHLKGAAADISDPNGWLKEFCISEEGLNLRDTLSLHREKGTVGWTHLQLFAPLSGKLDFYP